MNFDLSDYRRHRSRYSKQLKSLSKEPVAQASLALILSLLTVSFFGIFAIKPTLVTIAELMRTIKDKKEVNGLLQAKIEALTMAQANYERIKPDLGEVEKMLPQEALFLRLVAEINLLAWENDVVLESGHFGDFIFINKGGEFVLKKDQKEQAEESSEEALTPEESLESEAIMAEMGAALEKKHDLSELTFSLGANGEYKNLKKFVGDLNNIDRIVVIESVIYDTEASGEEGAGLSVNLEVKAFYFEKDQFLP